MPVMNQQVFITTVSLYKRLRLSTPVFFFQLAAILLSSTNGIFKHPSLQCFARISPSSVALVMASPYWASRSDSLDTPQSVGLLWTSDQPDTETSTWQHTTLKTDIHTTGGIRTHNPSKRKAADPRLKPLCHRNWNYLYLHILKTCLKTWWTKYSSKWCSIVTVGCLLCYLVFCSTNVLNQISF